MSKITPIPKDELDAAVQRMREEVSSMLHEAYLNRVRDWGVTKFDLAEKAGRPQAMIERMMSPEGMTGFDMCAKIVYACGGKLQFKLADLENYRVVPEV